jgi:hypothetical protein
MRKAPICWKATKPANGLRSRSMALGRDADSVWERKKLEARKMLENRAGSPASSAYHLGARAGRCVGRLFLTLIIT